LKKKAYEVDFDTLEDKNNQYLHVIA